MNNNETTKPKNISEFKEQYKKALGTTRTPMMTAREKMVVLALCVIVVTLIIEIIEEVWIK